MDLEDENMDLPSDNFDLTTPEGAKNYKNKADWEGGWISLTVNYGLLPDGPPELVERLKAWREEAYKIEKELFALDAIW